MEQFSVIMHGISVIMTSGSQGSPMHITEQAHLQHFHRVFLFFVFPCLQHCLNKIVCIVLPIECFISQKVNQSFRKTKDVTCLTNARAMAGIPLCLAELAGMPRTLVHCSVIQAKTTRSAVAILRHFEDLNKQKGSSDRRQGAASHIL